MGQDRRGLGEEEDPRVRQQQDALAVATVSALTIVASWERERDAAFFFLIRTADHSRERRRNRMTTLYPQVVVYHGRIVAITVGVWKIILSYGRALITENSRDSQPIKVMDMKSVKSELRRRLKIRICCHWSRSSSRRSVHGSA